MRSLPSDVNGVHESSWRALENTFTEWPIGPHSSRSPSVWSMWRCVNTIAWTRDAAPPSATAVLVSASAGPAWKNCSSGTPNLIAPSRVMPVSTSRIRPSAHSSTKAGCAMTKGASLCGSPAGSITPDRGVCCWEVSMTDSLTGTSPVAPSARISESSGSGSRASWISQCSHASPPATMATTSSTTTTTTLINRTNTQSVLSRCRALRASRDLTHGVG